MPLHINKDKGFSEAILDTNCGFEQFYRVADLLATTLHITFTHKVDDFDTLYWEFSFNQCSLLLHYNIYTGISILPKGFTAATEQENKAVEQAGELVYTSLYKST